MPDEIVPRVEKVEEKVEKLEVRVDNVEAKIDQGGRIQSDIQSEVGLTRRDIGRVEEKLFGKGDDEYGGRIGQITKRLSKLEMAILSIGGAAAIVMFLFMAYQFFVRTGGTP